MAVFKTVVVGSCVTAGVAISFLTGIGYRKEMLIFDFEGSASMKPIMEFLLNKYSESDPSKTIAFNISTIGSNSGLQKLLSGHSDFALVSHDISEFPKNEKYKQTWKDKKLKTITLATETMAILYKPPKGCDKKLIISEDNIQKLYSAFSGFSSANTTTPIRLKDLLDNGAASNSKCDISVVSWVKSTGPAKSGTAKAFVDNPLLKKKCVNGDGSCKDECGSEWCKKIKSGYGTDHNLHYAPEPTNLHWDTFKHHLKEGNMTYLPSHFVFQNWDIIDKLGIKLAEYKKKDGTTLTLDKNGNIENHEWTRSYNIVYSTENLTKKPHHKALMEFLAVNSKCLAELKMSGKKYTLSGSSNSPQDMCTSVSSSSGAQVDVSKPDETS